MLKDRDNRDCRLSSHQIVVEVVQHNDTASISADSGHQTDSAPELTSTFKPELLLVPTDESVANRISGSTSFHYERYCFLLLVNLSFTLLNNLFQNLYRNCRHVQLQR